MEGKLFRNSLRITPEGPHLPSPEAPDRQIRIVSTSNFTKREQEKIRSSKNIDLQIAPDPKSSEPEEAEVVMGAVDGRVLQRAKKLKWVNVLPAGVQGKRILSRSS